MKISQRGIDLIKQAEGLRLEAYQDSVRVWTIGYGHTREVRVGQVITEKEAEGLLREDLDEFERGVLYATSPVKLTQGQFDALVSFSFNLGLGSLNSSTLLKKLKAGDASGASFEFQRWVYADAKKLPGLVKRREAERQLFISENESAA